ncbi:protein ImuA [Mucilaginibacter gossypiicola]|uniref:Protein ImuA n=1 Tax=Mucilaginibacter gossypiicola TaxID=551995 RepID=A0A1H8KK23_9SPHI|nr:Error-prone repair protein ImuA [Mucilaginibacter gossypiicola]SEN93309.1 protein ImuA [Mucilaginibacter gossypiicola]
MPGAQKDIISRLQKDILLWQGFTPPLGCKTKGIGLGPLESAFPNGVFPTGTIHEMLCPTYEHAAATGGLIAGLLTRLMQQGGVCLWVSMHRQLFPAALASYNVEPHRVIFIDVQHEKDLLWVMEEALKCEGLAAVIAEVREISFAQSRRLQLAVENSKVTGFLLRNDPRKLGSTTCVARWQITPLPSQPHDGLPGLGFPRWQIDLLRVRNGNPGSWKLEWIDGNFIPVEEEKTVQIDLHERIAG